MKRICNISSLALVMIAAAGACGAEAANKLPNTGILLSKAAHEAGRLVIVGKTRLRANG